MGLSIGTGIGISKGGGLGYLPETTAYRDRVEAAGGEVVDLRWTDTVLRALKDEGVYSSAAFVGDANMGVSKDGTGAVDTLFDASGNKSDATQATTAAKPTHQTDANFGGKHVVSFDGTDDTLTTASIAPWAADEVTAFIVQYEGTVDDEAASLYWGLDNTNRFNVHLAWTDDTLYLDYGDLSVGGRISAAQPAGYEGATHVLELHRQTDGTSEIVVDGAVAASGSMTDALDVSTAYPLHLGSGDAQHYMDTPIATWLALSAGATSQQRAAIRSILKDYYATP